MLALSILKPFLMNKLSIVFFLISLYTLQAVAQTEPAQSDDLLQDITTENNAQPLLPEHYPFTQRLLWGQKGLMRNFDAFELTPEKRQKELLLRRKMLVAHQVLGFATLGGMIAQGIVGARLYNGHDELLGTHESLAAGVNIGYFTTAGLSLFAPPKMLDERRGLSSIKIHKYLAIVHLSSMIATNILAGQAAHNPDIRPYHRAAAYTAFGAYALSMIVIKF